MRDLSITEEHIAASKDRWEPDFRAFAQRTSESLASSRRLPIYAHAVALARTWLNDNVAPFMTPPNRSLALIGDEHLYAASRDILDSVGIDYTHIFPDAWTRWHDTEFRGHPWFWCTMQWSINDSQRLIHFAEYTDDPLILEPNVSYLLSQAVGSRGTDSICRMQNGSLIVDDPYCEWVDSI